MRLDLWEYSWKLQLLLTERIQPCKWFSLWRHCNDFVDVSADDINWGLNIKNRVECWNKNYLATGLRNNWVDGCSLTRYKVTFITLGILCCSYPTLSFYTFFFKNSVWVLLFFEPLATEIFLWLLLDYREEYSLLLHQFTVHVLRYRWVQCHQTSYSMRSDLWEYFWKLQVLLSERIQPCK